ncbi:putative NADP(+)-dependent dehydrogenase [Thermoascus aurantiacus ATCC 26904]
MSSFPYKKILVVGATSGIGLALSERFVQRGIFVIAVGRRKENLDKFVQAHGPEKAAAIQFDITKLDAIPAFAQEVMKSHPDLDCVFLNSGMQRGANFRKPETLNVPLLVEEMTTNYLSYLAMAKEFLPFLMEKKTQTALICTSSGLAMVPITRCPNYCASKAALHHWLLVLREQLKETNVKVIEIFPPAVQTELHDAKHQPDIVDGGKIGIPLEEFTDEALDDLLNGMDQIAVGTAKGPFNGFEQERQKTFARMVEIMKAQGLDPK